MSKNPPVFRSIPAPLEASDEALHALGDQLGVPKMVKPEPVSAPKIEAAPVNLREEAVSAAAVTPGSARESLSIQQNRAFEALSRLTDTPTALKREAAPSPRIDTGPSNFGAAAVSEPPRPASGYAKRGASLHGQGNHADTAPAATPEKVTIMLPTYLTAALRRECAERRTTIRSLVVMGLQSLGFEVHERDLSPDFRRDRSRSGS